MVLTIKKKRQRALARGCRRSARLSFNADNEVEEELSIDK